ncbi:MAG TPA: outer membrane beta-barrel protein [Puia sp.]|nr:outer membrane beta-barrel protein [Puia sp.]
MKSIKILLFMIAFSPVIICRGQEKGNSFIGLNGGASFPIGNWGKVSTATSLTSLEGTVGDQSGYANTGGFFAIDGAWFFSKHFAVGGMFKYGSYNLHGMDSLSYGYEESFDVDTTRLTHTDYKIWSIMPGLYYQLQIAKKLSLTARGLIGISNASTPQITVTIEDGGVFDTPVVQYSSSKTSFAFDAGAGLRYEITGCLAINLKADYFYTDPDFTINNSSRVNNAGREITEYHQPLTSFNASLGIAYVFSRK